MIRRGDVVIAALTGEAGHKPRPAVIVQDDALAETTTVLVVPFTSSVEGRLISRPLFQPDDENGLEKPSCLMTDRLMPTNRSSIRDTIGHLSPAEMTRVETALLAFLGMARS